MGTRPRSFGDPMPVGGICVMAAGVKLLENDGGPVRLSEIYCNASVTSHEIVNIGAYINIYLSTYFFV